MDRAARQSVIMENAGRHESLDVGRLASSLGVSQATIRRDLSSLDEQGLLRRTYGGARAAEPGNQMLASSPRTVRRFEQKRRIARAALRFIPDDVTMLGLTAGTTTTELGRHLRQYSGLAVVTTALNIALDLVSNPHVRVVIAGGEARAMSLEVVGPMADEALSRFEIDVAFLGVDAIDAQRGCLAHDALGASTNRVLVRQAKQTVVLADSSKLGAFAVNPVCPMNEVDVLVTDDGATPRQLDDFRGAGVTVEVV